VNERGVNPTDPEWAALLGEVVDALPGAQVLAISGSLPPGAPATLLPLLIGTARDAGVPVIVDTSGPGLLHAADAGASVLKPNAAELVEATGITDPVDGARSLIERGVDLVLLSLGADGMLAVTASDVLHARLDAPLAGNPTGAGDAGVAACAVLYADGIRDPETILRRATAWSAAAVLMPLAGEISDDWRALDERLIVAPFAPAVREERP
jgi:fructose-1-phosphate kinase PfkB-like protein